MGSFLRAGTWGRVGDNEQLSGPPTLSANARQAEVASGVAQSRIGSNHRAI